MLIITAILCVSFAGLLQAMTWYVRQNSPTLCTAESGA